jgi:hypothetical protein
MPGCFRSHRRVRRRVQHLGALWRAGLARGVARDLARPCAGWCPGDHGDRAAWRVEALRACAPTGLRPSGRLAAAGAPSRAGRARAGRGRVRGTGLRWPLPHHRGAEATGLSSRHACRPVQRRTPTHLSSRPSSQGGRFAAVAPLESTRTPPRRRGDLRFRVLQPRPRVQPRPPTGDWHVRRDCCIGAGAPPAVRVPR